MTSLFRGSLTNSLNSSSVRSLKGLLNLAAAAAANLSCDSIASLELVALAAPNPEAVAEIPSEIGALPTGLPVILVANGPSPNTLDAASPTVISPTAAFSATAFPVI